ncbi:hypothetical protein WEH80_30910 [Actinomycetes bacterium KLBMP 9759]
MQLDDREDWATDFRETMAAEIFRGVRAGALTKAEADQLLARLLVVLDQAVERSRQLS